MESGVQNKIFITILSILSLSTFSEEFKVKKTWFGDPDLQGVWTNASLTTLERPDHFDALEISDEVADYAKKASQDFNEILDNPYEEGETPDKFVVSGRGELHLAVLIETMRREGYELAVSKPEVIVIEQNGTKQEPYESLLIDCDDQHKGSVIEELGARRAELQDLIPDGKGRVRIEFKVPTRGLIGFRSLFLSLTSGSGLMTHNFDCYGDYKEANLGGRVNGVLVSMVTGKTLGYALFNLQERGRLFVEPNVEVYEGMIVGVNSRGNDLVVNPTKAKQLTNIRASGSDENILLTPPISHSLERAMEFISEDELVEITPNHIRLRKKHLTENERKRSARQQEIKK